MKKISYIFILWSIIFIFVNMSFNYYPAINSNGIIIWDTPPLLNIIYSIAQFLPLVLIIGISLITYINSKLEYTKPLLLFIGFMAILVGGVFQEYAIEPMAFYIVNFTIFFGFITVLLAQFSKDEK
ncbi:hypothetical protein HGB13_01675 [bacterium]|nr:hypothetical protein [bacterium]